MEPKTVTGFIHTFYPEHKAVRIRPGNMPGQKSVKATYGSLSPNEVALLRDAFIRRATRLRLAAAVKQDYLAEDLDEEGRFY